MKVYQDLLRLVLEEGVVKEDRTGVGTRSIFAHQMRFDLNQGFPLLTTKKIHFKSVIYELLWFLRGDTNVRFLQENGVSIWDEWADEKGDLGPVYGKQWRNFSGVDQIEEMVRLLKEDPNSRRILLSTWNVPELSKMALAPCHVLFQFYVASGRLSCQLYQRSADVFLGVPFNIASYSALTMMMAQQTGLELGEFVWVGGDVHLYENHLNQARLQLERTPYPLPKLLLKKAPAIDRYAFSDFELVDYKFYPAIKASVAV